MKLFPRLGPYLSRACISVVLLGLTACLADIRPAEIRDRAKPRDTEAARALLLKAARAQCGPGASPEQWRAQRGVFVRLEDEWQGIARLVAPWPENPQALDFIYAPARDASLAVLLDPLSRQPAGPVWGIHEWNAWKKVTTASPADYSDAADAKFLLPTIQYFLELPFRIPYDAALVDTAGTARLNGIDYDVVYATWETYGPNPHSDQYVLYLRKDDGRLEHAGFTVRDNGRTLTAAVHYLDFRAVGAYTLPFELRITRLDDPDAPYHTMRVRDYRLDYPLTREAYAPRPDRPPASK